jgi:polyisoprenoid-binding protein YceI
MLVRTLVATLICALPALAVHANPYIIDPTHTSVIFKINHMGVANFYGMFGDTEGTVTFDPENLENCAVEATIKTASVNTLNAARDAHLRAADYFDAEQYPDMTFKSGAWKKTGEKTYEVAGDLTLRGVTQPVTMRVEHTGAGKGRKGEELIGFEATLTIQRTAFGMNEGIGALGDDVAITISLEAAR